MTEQSVPMILVGGFLGAGKTTLLWQAARRLAARGKRVGLITNDQAPDLVDSGLLSGRGLAVQEVAGSCFCCDFPGLLDAAHKLRHGVNADVLIAEPVGSCTDLSATVLQPLKDRFCQQFVLAPLSVLVDPQRLREVLSGAPGRLHDSAAYIVRKQMEEADAIIVNKSDLLGPDERQQLRELLGARFPDTEVRCLSAITGEGVDEWVAWALQGGESGRKIVEVDYDTYAEGEAVLGWLNAAIRLSCRGGAAPRWREFCTDMLNGLQNSCKERAAEVGHIKVLLSVGERRLVANLTRTDGEVAVRGDAPDSGTEAKLVVNARVEMSSGEVERLVRARLQESCRKYGIEAEVWHLRSLSPGRPSPTYRYAGVVGRH